MRVLSIYALVIASAMSSTRALDVRKVVRSIPLAVSLLCATPALQACATPMNDPEAMTRYNSAQAELIDLDRNWETIVKSGGDGVRRRLGTVYSPPKCSSSLCSFNIFTDKFVRQHLDDLDFAEFEGPSAELLQALNQADFLAYSANFADYGNGGGGVDYLDSARAQVKQAIASIAGVLAVLNAP